MGILLGKALVVLHSIFAELLHTVKHLNGFTSTRGVDQVDQVNMSTLDNL